MRTRRFFFAPLITAVSLPILGVSSNDSFGGPIAAFAFSSPSSGKGDESNDIPIEKKVNDEPKYVPDGAVNGDVNGAVNGYSSSSTRMTSTIAYRSLSISINKDTNVPVAVWYPTKQKEDASDKKMDGKKSMIMDYPKLKDNAEVNAAATYQHRISLKKIGKLLVGWDLIPEFASKDFTLKPTLLNNYVVDGVSLDISIPKNGPLILLAHGYLGSRFDLSHLAEQLAQEGFTCMSPEYPESLASSYPVVEGIDRSKITEALLKVVTNDLNISPSSYGIVGHSLGCGTVMTTGDDTWTRVCIAGPPVRRDGIKVDSPVLVLTSVNDGAVTMSRMGGMITEDFVRLEEQEINLNSKLPRKAALIFDRPDAPNHISFLTESVNQAMIDFLSPILPFAQALNIPVLDFDKYKESQDSKQTADVVIPIISAYLKQNMKF
eukprot:CAMPEP_0197826624 /NCGR_PEP_ID=MMETSP1437-20131217/3562_1 /TAXON_ID=49252 ORGANISM="Eucampia antarctica, Strain CCMP1452" /NCGR_SAMPLE_ID=MMETSP1437 /ASSEMBLY_ACC=CAM_ASM_001096 /LENGTH=433 /DNA_ID=CAMNT_0043427141 /DNA_START=160 /DNA_END=1461 /DNA_ORIENTATION=+